MVTYLGLSKSPLGLENRRLKILIHDFAGHPFQVALSRELADRGHAVTHAFFAEDPGPKGAMRDYRSGNGSVHMRPLSVGRPYAKGNFIRRLLLDLRYRGVLADTIRGNEFDIVLSSNTPTWIQGLESKSAYCSIRQYQTRFHVLYRQEHPGSGDQGEDDV